MSEALAGYAADAAALAPRYAALRSHAVLAAFAPVLPRPPARILDLGAGPGRDALRFAAEGHAVLAVEPVAAFRAAAPPHPRVAWLDDRLPDLPRLAATGRRFDLVLLAGVWHHLDPPARAAAMPRLAAHLAPGGALALSLRHGPGAPGRPVHPAEPAEARALAAAAGLALALEVRGPALRPANRAAGVSWTRLAFRAPAA